MGNIFSDLVAKLTRRQKKNKPVLVPVPSKPEPPIKAVTYNRVDGQVSGAQLKGGVVWDDIAKVYTQEQFRAMKPPLQQTPYKGTNYFVQAQEAERLERERRIKRYDQDNDDFMLFASATEFDQAWFYQNEETAPEIDSKPLESPSGYDYPRETFSPVYEAPSYQYEPPTSTTTYDTGSSWTSSGDSGSSSTDSGSSSSYDSGGSW
jgi:hypothetical protein